MNPEDRWARVSEILSRALDLPESERTGYLAEELRKEPSLRTEVYGILEELNSGEEFLEGPAAAARDFGAYRVVSELGEGGMGVVYLGERSDGQFARRVAIKRIGDRAPSVDAVRRFGDERRILARLDHANIARLLDAGIDGAGVPYLVMEHVEGEPLTRYCRERKLTLPERLGLFVKVCGAVSHAHQNLVIHRDLKPANILVTPEGEPKLLDFGIARMMTDTPMSEDTRTLNRALTLDYASPEQVRGLPVTTASDVYSLGVVLYEILTGVKPYETGAHGLSEAVLLVCDFTPRLPSEAAPLERRSEISGDLDSIVRKAMEKAPGDRYASVADLSADVAAHLDHRPVRARRPSFGYVALKFAKRHRAATTAAAAALVLFAGAFAAVLWQARVAARERDRAQKRFEEVRQLANYVIFDLQDGVEKLPGSTELRRGMVERSLAHLNSLAEDSADDERLQLDLARAYARLGDVLGRHNVANLGDREGALSSYDKARELLRQVLSRNPRDAQTRRDVANLLLSLHNGYALDRRDVAGALLEECTHLWEELVEEDPTHEDNLRGLASTHFSAYLHLEQDWSTAVPHMELALELFENLLEAQPQDLNRKRNVALCHKYLNTSFVISDPPRAFHHAREAARLDSERVAAEPHNAQAKLDYSFDLSALANYHVSQEEYDEAIPYFEQALALRRELWEADRGNAFAWNRLAYMLMRLGETLVLAGRPLQAVPPLREAVEHSLKQQEQPSVISTLARAYVALGEVELASKRDPCSWYRRIPELTPDWKDAASYQDLGPEPVIRLRNRALERLDACD